MPAAIHCQFEIEGGKCNIEMPSIRQLVKEVRAHGVHLRRDDPRIGRIEPRK